MEGNILKIKKVTIVVPIYGDLPSLTQCIQSLSKFVDTNLHKILLVNDNGPDADIIEESILKQIKNKKGFQYERNQTNLGFIGTCNRAVYELDSTDNDILLLNSDTLVTEGFLDEMLKVLYVADKHGAVCPRSNNATIASVPFLFKDGNVEMDREVEYTKKVYNAIKDFLPYYTITPVAHGFCMLIKRFLIKDFGLFDPVYGLGYNEENDFSMRINQYGYSSVMANKALVYHLESKSFTSDKKRILQEKNHKILTTRYPQYENIVADYLRYGIDPVDRFADIIATQNDDTKKILINFYHLPLSMNGTARNCLSFLKMIKESPDVVSGKISLTILASKEAASFHNLNDFGVRIIKAHEINELFHLAICPLQIFHSDNLQLMNRCSLKIVYAHLDIIAIRSNYLLQKSIINRTIFQDALRVADKVIMISDFTKRDTSAYYSSDKEIIEKKSVVVLQGYPDVDFTIDGADIDHSKDKAIELFINEGDFILIIGNDFRHKMVKEAVQELSQLNKRMIVLGASKLASTYDHVLAIESGGLSDDTIRLLFKNTSLVVFPSVYEGFGLPIAEAAKYRKRVLVSNYSLNHEVAKLYENYGEVHYFDSLNSLAETVEKLSSLPYRTSSVVSDKDLNFRTITDYNREVLDVVLEVINEPLDPRALRSRWEYLARIDQYMVYAGNGRAAHTKSIIEQSAHFLKSKDQRLYLFARSFYRKTLKKQQ